MKKKIVEQKMVFLLFVLVLIVFSFAQRDTQKLDRLYQTAQTVQKTTLLQTVQAPPAAVRETMPQ